MLKGGAELQLLSAPEKTGQRVAVFRVFLTNIVKCKSPSRGKGGAEFGSPILLPGGFPDRVKPMTGIPSPAEQLVEKATALWRAGRYGEAIALCDEALKLDPNFAPAFLRRGAAKSDLGRFEEAIKDYDEAMRLKPDYATAYYNRGLAKYNLRQLEDAVKDYDEAIRLKPDYANAYNNRGNAKDNLGRHEEAIKDYDETIRLKPDYAATAYYNRGLAKSDLGRFEEAIKDYDEAIRLDPKYAPAYNNRGVAKSNLGRFEEAIKDYDEAIRLDPKYAPAYNNRARLLFQLEKFEEASKNYQEANKLNPALKDSLPNIILAEVNKLGLQKEEKANIENALQQLVKRIEAIKKQHLVKIGSSGKDAGKENAESGGTESDNLAAHYTSLAALRSMLPLDGEKSASTPEANHARLYNAAYMNDPDEGQLLVNQSRKMDGVLHNFFPEESYTDEHHKFSMDGVEYSVYLCSFTLSVDRLDLWRAYGADGRGFCIATPLGGFNDSPESIINALESSPNKFDSKKSAKQHNATVKVPPVLYKIEYGQERIKQVLSDLDSVLNPLLEALKTLDKDKGEKVKTLVRILLSDILYLYKNEQYATEKEARILRIFGIDNISLKIDEGTPGKVYAQTEPFLFSDDRTKIIIGPKAEEKTKAEYELKYRINKNKHRVEVIRSKIQYR